MELDVDAHCAGTEMSLEEQNYLKNSLLELSLCGIRLIDLNVFSQSKEKIQLKRASNTFTCHEIKHVANKNSIYLLCVTDGTDRIEFCRYTR